MRIAIIGGGPAGLRAAEVAAAGGAEVSLFEAKPSVGRKFLVAGRGGLNLTHGEEFGDFIARYLGPDQPADFWRHTIGAFTPADLRAWAAGLGIETFQQRTGRVYPREMKAAPLLRRWIQRLRDLGVSFHMNHRWTGLTPGTPHRLTFHHPADGHRHAEADTVILALGGASWPITGSDGGWVEVLTDLGVAVSPLVAANCGWETPWPAEVLAAAEGQPLKNLLVRAGEREARGELLVTAYGLEGGAIYQLGPWLRAMERPCLHIDFKPDYDVASLRRRMESVKKENFIQASRERWKLPPAVHAIFTHGIDATMPLEDLAIRLKRFPILLDRPRPVAEAISTAGGVLWKGIDSRLMLKACPGIYVAGEMIDWEAPTGGYLMQGCFATGSLAARSALAFHGV